LGADWLASFPFCSYHAQPVAPQLKARNAELAKFRAQVALAEAHVNFKTAQVEFLELDSQPSGSDLGDDMYKILRRVKPEKVDKRIDDLKKEIEKLKEEITKLEETKIKELQATVNELTSVIKALRLGEGERGQGSSFWCTAKVCSWRPHIMLFVHCFFKVQVLPVPPRNQVGVGRVLLLYCLSLPVYTCSIPAPRRQSL